MCTGYVAGGNTRFFGAEGKALSKAIDTNKVQEAMSARLSFDDDASGEYDSMLAFACPYGEDAASSRDQVISISERLLPWEVSKNQDPQKSYFPGGSANFKTYMNKFQLNQIHFGEDVRASESMAFMSSESEQEDVRRSFLSLNSLLPPLEPSFLAHSSPSHPLLRPHEPPSHCPTPLGPLLERHPRM